MFNHLVFYETSRQDDLSNHLFKYYPLNFMFSTKQNISEHFFSFAGVQRESKENQERGSGERERGWLRQSNAKLLSWVFAPLAEAPWRSSLYRCHRHGPPPSYQHWNSYTLISPVHFKTSILIHIFQGQFVDSYDPTIEETFNKNIKIRNQVNWKHSTYLEIFTTEVVG